MTRNGYLEVPKENVDISLIADEEIMKINC